MTIAQIRSGNVAPARSVNPEPAAPSEGGGDFAQMMALQSPAEPGGDALKAWIDSCPNQLYSALTYQGGGAWRARLDVPLQFLLR